MQNQTEEGMTMAKAAQARLPGVEDLEIEELQEAALSYADIRDQRMALTPQETELKGKLLGLMKKYEKKAYEHDGIRIEVVAEEETVKVRVKKEKEDDD
jgi:hypothetical protein